MLEEGLDRKRTALRGLSRQSPVARWVVAVRDGSAKRTRLQFVLDAPKPQYADIACAQAWVTSRFYPGSTA